MDKQETIKYKIKGMHCASCALNVEKALKKTRGVLQADVNLANSTAIIKIDSSFSPGSVYDAVRNTGYDLEFSHISVGIGNMNCVSCAEKINDSLMKLDGIYNVSIDLSLQKADIDYDDTRVTREIIRQTIENLGYRFNGVFDYDEASEGREKVKKNSLIRRLLGL